MQMEELGAPGEETQIDIGGGAEFTVSSEKPEKAGYKFVGWRIENGSETIYVAGNQITTDVNIKLVAVWGEIKEKTLDTITWYTNEKNRKAITEIDGTSYETDIGSMTFENNGTTVTMKGNTSEPGKNAIWSQLPENCQLQSIEFGYSIDFGDSFNAAGILIGVEPGNELTTGYFVSFNNTWSGNSWVGKFKYNMENTSNIETSETSMINIARDGKMTINLTEDGFEAIQGSNTITKNGIINFNKTSFGFFSDHYSHGCWRIGNFRITDIKVTVLEW